MGNNDTANTNILKIWRPIDEVPERMYLEALHDDSEGFRILIRADREFDTGVLRITFKDRLTYKNTNEKYLLDVWHNTPKPVRGKTFYKVENSSFITSFHELNLDFYKKLEISHYAVYTVSDCIDILSVSEPIVEWV